MSEPTPQKTLNPRIESGTSTLAIFTTLLMSGLFLLKGNTINIECVGCLHDPAAGVAPVATVVTETVTKSPKAMGIEYDCNQIQLRPFDKPPLAPPITSEMLEDPAGLIPVLTKLSSDQRQYIYDYDRHVDEMISKHNALCK